MLITLMLFYRNFITCQYITPHCITSLNYITPTRHNSSHVNTLHHTTLHHITLHGMLHSYTVSLSSQSEQGGLLGWFGVMCGVITHTHLHCNVLWCDAMYCNKCFVGRNQGSKHSPAHTCSECCGGGWWSCRAR
jgi:hypothetical protein